MNRLIILIFLILSCEVSFAQTIPSEEVEPQFANLVNAASLLFQEKKYNECETKLREAVAYYTKLSTNKPHLAHPYFLYAPYVMLGFIEETKGNADLAIEYYESAFRISTQYPQDLVAGGLDISSYIGLLCSLRDLYVQKALFENAKALTLEIVNACRKYLPDARASQLYNLANIYIGLGEYKDAEAHLKEAMDIIIQSDKNEENIKTAFDLLSTLISTYYLQCQYQEAIQCKDIYKNYINAIASQYQDEIYHLNVNVVKCYYQLDLFEEAFRITQQLAAFAYNRYGEYSEEYVGRINDLAQLYVAHYEAFNDNISLDNAHRQFEYAAKIWEHINDKSLYKLYGTFLNNYGLLYGAKGEYRKSEKKFREALRLYQERNASTDCIITTSINLASSLQEQKKNDEALTLYQQIIDLCNTDSVRYAPNKIKTYRFLSLLYLTAYSNIQQAEEYADQAYQIASTIDGKTLEYASTLQILARIYDEIGDYDKSFDLQYRAYRIKTELNISLTPYELINLAEVASHHQQGTDNPYSGTISCCKAALEKLQDGSNEGQRARALDLLGDAYTQLGQFENAETAIKEASIIREKLFGKKSEPYQVSLNSLAILYGLQGNYSKAAECMIEAIDINDDMINRMNLLAIYYMSNDQNGVDQQLPIAWNKQMQLINNYFLFLDEIQRSRFIDSELVGLDAFYSIGYRFQDDICTSSAYNTALVQKGLLLGVSKDIKAIIDKTSNSQLRTIYSQIGFLQQQLNQNIDSLSRQKITYNISQKEKIIQREIASSNVFLQNLKLRWSNIRANLANKDVAIEFVNLYEDYLSEDNTTIYAALILRKDWDSPKMIPLCKKENLEQYTKNGFRMYDGVQSKNVYTLIWSKLEPYINKGDNVYFSPSGLLHQINIEVLKDAAGIAANEKYNLYRVSSTRELCREKQTSICTSAILYGGLQYEMDSTVMVAQSRFYQNHSDDYIATRGFNADSTLRSGWNYLEGTGSEIDSIANQLLSRQIDPIEYKGITGTEESFKALSGKKTPIIHIATHGFFYKDDEVQARGYFQLLDVNENNSREDNSMKRSGLILAGAQRAWLGEPIPNNVEDGILLAEEIAAMDLSGTDLVVLSACETGLGEITSEGVFGLQRAFKKAGVQTLIMSLWKVNDKATSLFMQTFYQNWLSGKSKHEAFANAQNVVRSHKDLTNPYYWASFIMLD